MQVVQVLKSKKQNSKQIVLNYHNINEIGYDHSFIYITTLCLSHNCIVHLNGIEQFVQLTTLSLHHNLIQNVSELSKISQPHLLKLLNVHHNPFTLNPVYSTVILQKFQNLEQLDNQKINKLYYQQYFIWVSKIGKLLIPYLIEDCVSEELVHELQIEIKKYDSCIYRLNQLIYTYLINHQYSHSLGLETQNFIEYGEVIFGKILDVLKQNQNNTNLFTCLINQALQDQDINLFEFQSDDIYRKKQLYLNFLQLNETCFSDTSFNFPYFPLCVDYVKSIIFILKSQCQRKNKFIISKCQQNTSQRLRSVSNQENTHRTINKTQSSMSIGKLKNNTNKSVLCSLHNQSFRFNSNQITLFVRILGNSYKKLKQQTQSLSIQKIKKLAQISTGFDQVALFTQQNQQKVQGKAFQILKQMQSFFILYHSLNKIFIQSKEEAFHNLVRLRMIYERKQWEKSIWHHERKIKEYFFLSLLINQQEKVCQKNALHKLLQKQRNMELQQCFSRWKIYSISEQFYNQVFPKSANEIKSLASISTKDIKQPNKSIYILDSKTTLEPENKSQVPKVQGTQSNGTTIYCEYVVLNKGEKKKKKKKKQNPEKNKKKQKCKICRDFVDKDGNIIEHK